MRTAHRHFGMQPETRSRGTLVCAALSLALLLLPPITGAQGRPTEFQVKAAYLFNFAKFVKWPDQNESDHDTFSICVLGSDPFGKVLDSTVAGEQIGGKPVAVRRLKEVSESRGCRILFVGRSEQWRLTSILASLRNSPVLTVSDIDGFAEHAGMIQFVMERDRVRFQVNLSATQKAGLTLSSELLKVATSVKGQAGD